MFYNNLKPYLLYDLDQFVLPNTLCKYIYHLIVMTNDSMFK